MPTCYSRDGAGGVTYNNWEFPLGHGGEVSIYRIAADPDVHDSDAPSRAKSPWLFPEFGLARAMEGCRFRDLAQDICM